MSGYLLDTNVASHVIKGDRPEIGRRLASLPMEDIAISAVTESELLFGLARRGYPAALTERVRQFLLRVDVLPWIATRPAPTLSCARLARREA
jgi:tRNA(fMet)-specific endonuclease VapC